MFCWLKFSLYISFTTLVFLLFLIYIKTDGSMNNITSHPIFYWFFPGKKKLTKKTTSIKKLSREGIDVPCIDQLSEELFCSMCFELFFEPSTTPCGHSFCRKCLKCTADKWKNCPNCKQSISNEGPFRVNTALWNTIQLIFPKESEEIVAAYSLNNRPAT